MRWTKFTTFVLMTCVKTIEKLIEMYENWRKPEIQLRNAFTGKYLGLTNKQYKKYTLTMKSADSNKITQVCKEVKERANRLNRVS